jgi:hypothetical protein
MERVSQSLSLTKIAYRTIGRTPPQQNSPSRVTGGGLSL